jgi:hypothetical protein
MHGHGFVVWNVCDNAWDIEDDLVAELDLTLNLEGNARGGFHHTLRDIRARARAEARRAPPING